MEHLQKQHLTTTMLKFMGEQFTLKKKVKGILYIQHLPVTMLKVMLIQVVMVEESILLQVIVLF